MEIKIEELIGKTFVSIHEDGNTLIMKSDDGYMYTFEHDFQCCEDVYIESIVGDLTDLLGSRLNMAAEEKSEGSQEETEKYNNYVDWTFYKFATIKGYVDIRWIGVSNGYYSTDVTIRKQQIS